MNSIEKQLGGGLTPTPRDDRDFSTDLVFGSIPVGELPTHDFLVADPLEIKDQSNTDMCTAFGLCSVSEDQEGVALDPNWVFAQIKKMRGEWTSWGADLRSGCKVAEKLGCLASKDSPFDFNEKGRDFVANWNNWPDNLEKKAAKHRKRSYFKVDGPHDTFDNIRMALWRHRNERASVYTGCMWRGGWLGASGGIIPREQRSGGFGHAFKVCGQRMIDREPYLVVQNSSGKDVGDEGLFYFPREAVNREFTYGAYQFVDMPPETARKIQESRVREQTITNPLRAFWDELRRRIKYIYAR